jgi:tetratricopeptide (TPR) repeat protein
MRSEVPAQTMRRCTISKSFMEGIGWVAIGRRLWAARIACGTMACSFVLLQLWGGTARAGVLLITKGIEAGPTQGEAAGRGEATVGGARALLKDGDLKGADAAVAGYLADHPESADGHFLRGYILFREHKAEASLTEYTEGAKYQAPEASDLKVVALDYVLLGAYSDADHWLTRSLESNATDAESWYYLGRTKYNENRFAEAIHAFEECLKLEPANVKAEANRGLAIAALGRAGEALAVYRHAIMMQQAAQVKTAEPFIDLGDLLLEQNQLEDALANLLKAREISPKESRVHESLGKVYLRLNKLPEAQTEFEKSISLAPGDAPAHYMLGQVYRKEGLLAEAKAEFDRAEKLSAKPSSVPQP